MADPFEQRFGRSFAAMKADEELRARLVNPNMSARRDSCKHGAPSPTPERLVAASQLIEAADGARSLEEKLAVAAEWAQRQGGGSAAAREEMARVLTCMATDAILGEDWQIATSFAFQADALRRHDSLVGARAPDAGPRPADSFVEEWRSASRWRLRRKVARAAGCGCLGRLAEAECALAGCGKLHDPDVAGGATLRACARCKRVHYCSVEHQRADWPRHKRAECEEKAETAQGQAAGSAE